MHIEERKVYVLVKDDGTEEIIDNPRAIEALAGIFASEMPADEEKVPLPRRKRKPKAEESPTPPIAETAPVKRRGRPPKAKPADGPSPALAEVRKLAAEAHLI